MMSLLHKHSCILCKYKHENRETCQEHEKCYSLSNIYYGTVVKYFPFKQIDDVLTSISYRKYEKYCIRMDKKYGNYALEDDDFKFIWGIKSWDDLSGSDCNMQTMNDIDIIHDKNKGIYLLGIETAYLFKTQLDECKYLRDCLNAFTKYMTDNKLDTDERFMLFMDNPCTDMSAKTIEELYMNFRIFVEGFCKLYEVE